MDIHKLIKEAKSDNTKPSEIVRMYLEFDEEGQGNFMEWLQQFEFESERDIERAVNEFAYCVCGDRYMSDKYAQENRVHVRCIWKRFNDLLTHSDKADKYAKDIAGRLWNGYYCRHLLEMKSKALLEIEHNEQTDTAFKKAWERIQYLYDLSDAEMHKLWFFVEQVKAGYDFPPSLRRMLYLWGSAKMTGKTTTANTIACLLNGEMDTVNMSHLFQTRLADEMQIGGFKVPKISAYNVCVMDECFYADMGKTYADFKRFLTSRNGRARLPYGQEFEWHGVPNYIATSNDSLKKFIKDWDDRRYLSVEFKGQPKEQLTFEQIRDLWKEFVVNSRPADDTTWKEWADFIAQYSNETGEKTEIADEFENEMLQNEFADIILNRSFISSSPTNNANRVTLKFFVDYFADHNPDARKRRSEIEAAALKVFGPRYNNSNFWLLSDMREVARRIKENNNNTPVDDDRKF